MSDSQRPTVTIPLTDAPRSRKRKPNAERTPPKSLGKAGRAYWRTVLSEYPELPIVEEALLEKCCTALDRIARLEELLAQAEGDTGLYLKLCGELRAQGNHFRMIRRELAIDVAIPPRKGEPIQPRKGYGTTGEVANG